MKLTITWNQKLGEGKPSKADVEALREIASRSWGDQVAVLDFLVDARFEAEQLYDELFRAVPGGTPCHSAEHAMPETTPKGEQAD